MMQENVNRELASLGAKLTSANVNDGYITYSKSNINSMVQDTEENKVLPPQEPTHNDNEDALAGAAATLSLLSPSTDNSNSQHLNHYDHTMPLLRLLK